MCEKSFRQYSTLFAHRHRNHGNKRRTEWKCDLCSAILPKKITLLQHMRNIHKGEGLIPCRYCDKSFLYKEDVALHSCWKHGSFDGTLPTARANKRKTTNLTDDNCTTLLENEGNGSEEEIRPDIENSDDLAGKESNLPHTCEICKLKFHYFFLLEEHMYIHTGKNAFKCEKCKEDFQTKREYMRHLDEHENEISFFCDICDKTMVTADAVHKHLEIHLGKRKYNCCWCNASFPYREQLRKHIALHDEKTDFQCCVCHKQLNDELEMKRHKTVFHETKAPFTCLECKEDLYSAMNLYRHKIQVHWKTDYDTKFECEHCSGTFLCEKDLSRHLMGSHPQKPYSCMLCRGKFFDMQYLIGHFKRQHEGERITEGKTYRVSDFVMKTNAGNVTNLEEEVQETEEMIISTVEGEDGDTAVYEPEPEVFDQDVIIDDTVDTDSHQFEVDDDDTGKADMLHIDSNQNDVYRPGSGEDNVEIKLEPKRPKGLNKKVKPYQCLICKKKVSEMRYLMIHFKECHEEERMIEGETYSIADDQLQNISKIIKQTYSKPEKKASSEHSASCPDNTVVENVEVDGGSNMVVEYIHLEDEVIKIESADEIVNEEMIINEPVVADNGQIYESGLGESFVVDVSGNQITQTKIVTSDSVIDKKSVETDTQPAQKMGLKLKTKTQSYDHSGLLFVKSKDGRLKINRKKPSP